jgi:hypothetical protein
VVSYRYYEVRGGVIELRSAGSGRFKDENGLMQQVTWGACVKVKSRYGDAKLPGLLVLDLARLVEEDSDLKAFCEDCSGDGQVGLP